MDISNGQSTLITNAEKTSDPNWLGRGNDLLWLKSRDKNDQGSNRTSTEIIIGAASEAGKSYVAATIPGAISNVKLKALDQDQLAVLATDKHSAMQSRSPGVAYHTKTW